MVSIRVLGELIHNYLTLYPHREIRSADRPRACTSRPPPRVPPEGYGGSRGCSWTATARARWPGGARTKSDTYFASFDSVSCQEDVLQ